MTRRAPVLTDETARHPFLRSLPPHVRNDAEAVTAREHVGSGWRLGLADLKQFLAAYCASFLAVVVFFS